MKKLAYSPHYKEKIVKLRKYLDFHFGTQVRRKVFKEIDERIHLLQRFESMGIYVKFTTLIVIIFAFMLLKIMCFTELILIRFIS